MTKFLSWNVIIVIISSFPIMILVELKEKVFHYEHRSYN